MCLPLFSGTFLTAIEQNPVPCSFPNSTEQAGDTSRCINIFIALDTFPRNLCIKEVEHDIYKMDLL